MRWFYNMSIVKKIVFGFLVTCGITALVGYLGVSSMEKVDNALKDIFDKQFKGLVAAKAIQFDIAALERELRDAVINTGPADMRHSILNSQEVPHRPRGRPRRVFPAHCQQAGAGHAGGCQARRHRLSEVL